MKITCNKKDLQVADGATGLDIISQLHLTQPEQAVAFVVNGEITDFFTKVSDGDQVEILDFSTPLGKEVFWHSSAHILAQAVVRLFPEAQPTIGPAIASGFYYDFANLSLQEEDFPAIEKEMQKIIKENYRAEKTTFSGKDEALKEFQKNPYKVELIQELDESSPITGYRQGEFFDLCRGPHLTNLGKVKAIKLLKTSAAYWRGDSSRDTLTRVYGISFPDKKNLKEYLYALEEAKKRDHKLLGKKLDLFTFIEQAPGMPIFLPHGMTIFNRLVDLWRELHTKAGYVEIKTPAILNKSLWETSGHWENYRENMYSCIIDEKVSAIKPMNCPACMLVYAQKNHSYRDLPLRIGEIGYVHRHELSGSLSGLLRVRAFHQDDAHIFLKPEDIKDEIKNVLELADTLYNIFGLTYTLELSTRPEKNTIGTDEQWEIATQGLQDALEEWGKPYRVNAGDGAFYGPKIDFHIVDALSRSWQCGTIQLDMALPERFDLVYKAQDGTEKRTVMTHRALYGSLERFMAILIEHYAGKFPLWLSPRQVRILPVADRHISYAKLCQSACQNLQFVCELDDASDSLNKKIRKAQLDQVNYMCVVGDTEEKEKTITLRGRNNTVYGSFSLDEFLQKISEEREKLSLTSVFSKEQTPCSTP